MRRGELVYNAGQRDVGLTVVLRGAVEVFESRDGHEQNLGTIGPRNFAGDVAALTGTAAVANVRGGAEESEILEVPAAAIRQALAELPGVSEPIVRAFIMRRQRLRRDREFAGLRIVGLASDRKPFDQLSVLVECARVYAVELVFGQEKVAKYHSAADYAAADPAVFEKEIQSTGFFRNKTKSILGMAQALVERHGGRVPDTMEELVRLPGVGRKTANVVLGNAFGKNEGVVVDTHVQRITGLLRLTREKTPEKIEQDLMQLVPREKWTIVSHLIILHGRAVCIARRPRCEECGINRWCPSSRV